MLYVVEYRFNGGGVGKNVGERGKGPMRFTGLEVEAFKLLRTIFGSCPLVVLVAKSKILIQAACFITCLKGEARVCSGASPLSQ
jgi:hypothetical protein